MALSAVALALAGGIASPAYAQDRATDSVARFPVQGVVLNSLTREPIPRALVENNADAVLTDGEGRFELNLPQGVTQISVRRPGYNSRTPESGHAVNVAANTPELTFTLTPEASITGHVTLTTGEPAEGVTFLAYRRALIEGRELWSMGNSAATNSEGVFRMANLETPGVWIVCSVPMEDYEAPKAGAGQAPVAATDGYPPTCYPGPIPTSNDSGNSNTLALAPGQQADVEIVLNRQPFYRVTIGVPAATGAGAVDLQIHDPSGRNSGFSPEWSFQRAQAEVYLPVGQYYAESHIAGAAGGSYGRIDFRVGAAPLTGLSMSLLPLHPIPVEIRQENSAPSQGAQSGSIAGFRRGQEGPGVNLTLISADSAVGDPSGGALSQRPGSSLYELEGVVPGRYWVRTYAFGGYVASITSGGTDLAREPLEIGPGNSALAIQMTLRNDSGQIQCTVNPPQAADSAASGGSLGMQAGEMPVSYVYAIPTWPTAYQIPQMQGLLHSPEPITIPNLAPGTYRVVAYDQFQQINLSDAQQLAEIASRGQTVTVAAGATSAVQLDLIHASNPSPDESGDPVE